MKQGVVERRNDQSWNEQVRQTQNKRMRTGDGEKRRNVMIVVERMIDEKGLRNDSLKRKG